MTSRNDRKHLIHASYTVSQVRKAIDETVFGEENKKAMMDIFVGNMTYKEAAARIPISERGLQKRVKSLMPSLERQLKRMN